MTALSNIRWRNVSDGLLITGFAAISTMIICNDYIFIGTSKGVWRRPFSQLVKIDEPKSNFPLQVYRLYQNYPNPFNSETIISYHIPKYEKVQISIFDLSGKLVTNLIDEYHYPGNYTINWQGDNVGSGIYYIRLSTNNTAITRKCILIK